MLHFGCILQCEVKFRGGMSVLEKQRQPFAQTRIGWNDNIYHETIFYLAKMVLFHFYYFAGWNRPLPEMLQNQWMGLLFLVILDFASMWLHILTFRCLISQKQTFPFAYFLSRNHFSIDFSLENSLLPRCTLEWEKTLCASHIPWSNQMSRTWSFFHVSILGKREIKLKVYVFLPTLFYQLPYTETNVMLYALHKLFSDKVLTKWVSSATDSIVSLWGYFFHNRFQPV